MTRSMFERLLPVAGILAAVLYFIDDFATQGEARLDGKHHGVYVDWVIGHVKALVVSGVAGAYFAFSMLLFVISLRRFGLVVRARSLSSVGRF